MYSEISQVLNARPEQINTLLSKYRNGYRTIAPKQYFMDINLQSNDEMMGDFVTINMSLSGTLHQFQEHVSEPAPLRIIVEFDTRIDAIIAIVVEATTSKDKTRVTISTIDASSPYLSEFIRTLFVPRNLAHFYDEESQKFILQIQELVGVAQAS